MPHTSTTEQLERDAARIPKTDPQHQPDQSLHQQEIDRESGHSQMQQDGGEEENTQAE